MTSSGNIKGQRQGSCGHIMAAFDAHDKCVCCEEKKIGDDPCVQDEQCDIWVFKGAA